MKGFKSSTMRYWSVFLKWESMRESQLVSVIVMIVLLIVLFLPFADADEMDTNKTRAPGDGNYDDPEITVSLDEEVFYAEANPYPDNTASITGTVLCEIPTYVPSSVWVKLTITLIGVDINYDGNKELFATKEEPLVNYLITAYPKYNARAGETYDFEVQVLWTYSTNNGGSGNAEPVFGMIEIAPYGFMFMETVFQNPTMDVIIGEPFVIMFDLYNNGNSNCHVELAVFETPSFTDVTITPSELDMLSFGHEVIEATIVQKAGDEQEGEFKIRVLSDIPGAPTLDEFTFSIRSHREEEKIVFEPTIAVASGFILMFFVVMVGFIFYIRKMNKARKKMESDGGEEHYR